MRPVTRAGLGRGAASRPAFGLSRLFAIGEGIWLVSVMHDDPGLIDLERKTLQPVDNPFDTRSSPMS
jgi:hypothetical protein